MLNAVLWDFGGVIVSSPFEEFRKFEAERGLPAGIIRTLNATNPDANAWARLERAEISADEFDEVFSAEAASAGHSIAGRDVLDLLAGQLRPAMVEALDAVKAAGHRTACLTNNVVRMPGTPRPDVDAVMARFDVIVESSKIGLRKPEPAFYERACEMLGVEPHSCVFLDDLGINLKPAKAMGMTTIKVDDPAEAIAELERVVGRTLVTAS